MSKITEIRDNLQTLIETALPGMVQIPNPYELEKTANIILRKGYGIAFGPATNTERQLGCQLSIEREFAVILTKEVTATDHDSSGREAIEKAIFEEQYLLIKAIEQSPDLSGSASRARYLSDNGLEYVGLENSRYFVLQSTFACEYFEQLT
jgi:hypothetical protein